MREAIIDTYTLHIFCLEIPELLSLHGQIYTTGIMCQKADPSILLPLIEPEFEDVELALKKAPSNLAFASWVALFTAKRKRYVLITDSSLLRRECSDEYVATVNTAELLCQLYMDGNISLGIATDMSCKMNIEKDLQEVLYEKSTT